MTRVSTGFNFYLVLLVSLLVMGCSTTKDPRDKLSTRLRVHLEAQERQAVPPKAISVYRESPVLLSIESLYLISEDNVESARVIDEMGTYAIEIQFDRWAVPLLDHNSSSWQGRRIAIQAQWGEKGEISRWLAAPRLNRHIMDGVLKFTPDATLEETHDIVTGLNNEAQNPKKQLDW